MVHYPNDYKFGLEKQQAIFPILQKHFGNDLRETTERYAKYDFVSPNAFFELKSRKNKKNAYPTTLLTCNKVLEIKEDQEQYFIFNFTDELCYIKYDKDLFDTFEKKPYSRLNVDWDKKDYLFIPIDKLITI